VSDRHIADDEVLYRRIPPGSSWFEPPDRISSFNFKLRVGEIGLSLYRAAAVNASDLLRKPGAIDGSKVAQATAGQIRAAQDSRGNPLHLEIVPVNEVNDLGHAEIRGLVLSEHSNIAAKALKKLFKLIDLPPEAYTPVL
jgi:hypothetical protein